MRSLNRRALAPTGTDATEGGRNRPAPRGRRGRIAGVAITAIVAATLASGTVAPAYAALPGPVGQVDPVNGFPLSYSDGDVVLGQCLSGPQCVGDIERPNPGAPVSFPDNFPIEQFWFAAFAATPAQPGLYEAALEGAYANDTVTPGDEVAFGRIRIILENIDVGGTYTIQHPYGTVTVTDGGPTDEITPAGVLRITIDTGCVAANIPCGAAGFAKAGADFLGNVAGNPPSTFLRQENTVPGFIGDLLNPGPVTGAPSGTNAVIVTGPNINPGGLDPNTLTATDFGVSGRLAGAPAVPSAPTIQTATAGNASALVRWTAPGNGVSPVTTYHVRVVDAATGTKVIALRDTPAALRNSANSMNFTGLPNGTAVRFQIQAINALGISGVSAHSNAVLPASKPGSPKISTATAGIGSAVARWTPGATGGLLITKYHVRMVDAATGTKVFALRDVDGTARSLNFTGLARGTSVRFQVQAVNAKGMGPVSAHSNAVTPR